MKRFGCLSIILLLVGVALGIFGAFALEKRAKAERTERQLNGAGPIRPSFLWEPRPCRERTKGEQRVDDLMASALITSSSLPNQRELSSVGRNSISYFGWLWRQLVWPPQGNPCPPAQPHIDRIAPHIVKFGWPEANTEANDLQLISRLPPSRRLAEGLATIAFLDRIPPSRSNFEDSRPFARQLLGDQGRFAAPWGKRALLEINGDTRLATGAAYVAVAALPDVALPKVKQVMAEKLKQSQLRRVGAYRTGGTVLVIRPDDGDRLIELGYALARAGPAAEPYAEPVIAMLSEGIARPAPPFGLMRAYPTEFCQIARHIGGKVASTASQRAVCNPGLSSGDGSPRERR